MLLLQGLSHFPKIGIHLNSKRLSPSYMSGMVLDPEDTKIICYLSVIQKSHFVVKTDNETTRTTLSAGALIKEG